MNRFPRLRLLWSAPSRKLPVLLLVLLLPAARAAGQTVPYTTNGIVSIAGTAMIYNGRYVLRQSDFGFFYLDTQTLEPGHIQALTKCSPNFPPSDTGIYIKGDCWGITSVSSSGSFVVARAFISCPGFKACNSEERLIANGMHKFALGTWTYLGITDADIPDSTQTTDPQGRTWSIQPTDFSGLNFLWVASGQANSPPIANAFATNLSAVSRVDKGNYYGDKWQLQDSSSGGPSSILWDFNYGGSFVADESGSRAAEAVVTGYFPCDPVLGGNFRTASGCRQSLGLNNPPSTATYQFAEKSANQFGTSSNTFVSQALSIACPQVVISGYNGFTGTCNKTGGTLTAAAGGSADASGTKGNIFEALVAWSFTSPSGLLGNPSGPVVTIPNGTTGFAVTVTFPGGYQATAAGAVTLTPSLVATFTAPATVVRGTAFPVTNTMAKPATTTLDSVDWIIAASACGVPPAIPTNPVAPSFLTVGGSAAIAAPNSSGSFCIYLKFNYSTPNSQESQIASRGVTVTEWAPAPAIGIYLDAAKTQPAPFFGSSFFLNAGATYYLFDEEPPPPAGVGYPGANWRLSSPSGETSLGSNSTQGTFSAKFLKMCSSGCSLKLSVGGTLREAPLNVGSCVANGTALCVNGGRFNVQVAWTTPDGRSGQGQAAPLTADTGYFWFFSPNNIEMVLKVVDGRALNSAYWVFAGGLTNVGVTTSIVDTLAGFEKTYSNPQGAAFQPIQDTSAFAAGLATELESSLAIPGAGDGPSTAGGFPHGDTDASTVDRAPFAVAGATGAACVADATTLCLNNGRFKVDVQWTTSDGRTGPGQAVALTGDTGYFWFFSANNVEMVVKVVNGCAFNSLYWVFAGGLTNVRVVTTVTDTQTGTVKVYTNPQGIGFQPLQDTAAFPCP